MKKLYIISFAIATVLPMLSCSDFLDREPLTQPEASTFLTAETQVENYINGLYTNLPSFTTWGMGSRGEDKNSDNIVALEYDERLHGQYNQFSGSSDWQKGYQNIRKVNYFFYYYSIPEERETESIKSLKGEAFFLRAYWHFYLLKKFGSVPFIDKLMDENATVEGLQIPATPRHLLAEKILSDLNTAKDLLYPRSKYLGLRINKEAALTLAMNVALYEGSWENYHKGTDFAAKDENGQEVDMSKDFYQKVLSIGDELFKCGISLYKGGNDGKDPGSSFAALFNSKDLSEMDEVLLWRKYSIAEGAYHTMSGNLRAGITDTENSAGITQDLVNNYLKADGSTINPNDEIFKDFQKTFIGRDPRLLQTVMNEGAKWASATDVTPMHLEVYSKEKEKSIMPPKLAGDGNARSLTGYHIRLGIDTTYVQATSGGNSETALPIIRYAEALLAYAEAAEELGICTDDVLEKTLQELRERAGVSYVKPTQNDPYFSDFGYKISPIMQEIRRERRSEFALQGYRFDDLMRWRADKLIVGKRGTGAYMGDESLLMKSFSDENKKKIKERLTINSAGWADPMAGVMPNGYNFNPDRDYLMPIPPTELELNKKLKQNPNW